MVESKVYSYVFGPYPSDPPTSCLWSFGLFLCMCHKDSRGDNVIIAHLGHARNFNFTDIIVCRHNRAQAVQTDYSFHLCAQIDSYLQILLLGKQFVSVQTRVLLAKPWSIMCGIKPLNGLSILSGNFAQ